MRVVQMTLDEDLVESMDNIVKQLRTTRSAFAREALRDAIRKFNIQRLEQKHREGYERHPVTSDEFEGWEDEQEWGEP